MPQDAPTTRQTDYGPTVAGAEIAHSQALSGVYSLIKQVLTAANKPLRRSSSRESEPSAVHSYSGSVDTGEISREIHGDYIDRVGRLLEQAHRSEQRGVALTMLPLLTCEAAGGRVIDAVPVAAAWRSLHIAAKLLDDVEDGEIANTAAITAGTAALLRTPVDWSEVGIRVNLATALIAGAELCLAQLPSALRAGMSDMFARTTLEMARGQHLDLITCGKAPRLGLDEYFELITAKTGDFLALASGAGAASAGTCSEAAIRAYENFGRSAGIMLQLIDDLLDWRKGPGGGDLARGQWTLPVYYALHVALPEDREQLREWLTAATHDSRADFAARSYIDAAYAELYMSAEILHHKNMALSALCSCQVGPVAVANLEAWLDSLLSP